MSMGMHRTFAVGVLVAGILVASSCADSEIVDGPVAAPKPSSALPVTDGSDFVPATGSAENSVVEVTADSVWPTGDPTNIVLFADRVSTFEVTAERDGPAEGGEEPYIPRFVTVRVLDTVWTSPARRSPLTEQMQVGSEVELSTWGSVTRGDGTAPLAAEGMPRLEVGGTYIGAFVVSYGELDFYPGSLARVDGERVDVANSALLAKLVVGTDGAVGPTIDEIRSSLDDHLESPTVAAVIEHYPAWMELSSQDRLVLTWDESEDLTPVTEPEVGDAASESGASHASTTEAPLSLDDLLALPIDELPTAMYSVERCESVLRSAPVMDPLSDFSDVEYSVEEIADRADIVVHGAVQTVSDPVLIVPAGVPDGFLSATGATSPDQIAFGATSVAISVLESDPPDLVGPTETTGLLLGCIAESALAATSPGREVLILADVPDPGRGALGITDSEVRVLGWLEVSPKGLLRAHPTTSGTPNPFRALDGMTPPEAMERIAEVRPG